MTTIVGMATREEVVKEALSWLRTPYHKGAMVKGAGVDCGTFLHCVYRNCGIIREDDPFIERYSQDWFANAESERYLIHAMRHAAKIAEAVCNRSVKPDPGNFVLSRCVGSKRFNHGGIVVNWPVVIHAVAPAVETACVIDHRLWSYQQIAILDPWAKAAEKAQNGATESTPVLSTKGRAGEIRP
jgi:cell wall-associated NlpC family hydrolase